MSISAVSSQGLSVAAIKKRNQRAVEIGRVFSQLQPGERLKNANDYLRRLDLLRDLALKDRTTLNAKGIKLTPDVLAARKELDRHISVLQSVQEIASKQQKAPTTVPVKPPQIASPGSGLPWEGQLRPGEKTPLHWAVRNHDHKAALVVRYQLRQMELLKVCAAYAGTVKEDSPAGKILKAKRDLLPRLAQAVDIIHVLDKRDIDAKGLKEFFKEEPDVAKILQDPNFRKVLDDPKALRILNCQDVLDILDAKGVSPIHEAILQGDAQMTHILLFPHLVANPTFKTQYWARIQEIQARIAAMRQVDPNKLTPVCRAAFEGNVEELENANDIDKPDAKGLTPLHYALLGGQIESIQYLLPRANLYALTPQKHSYLDFAILSGNAAVLGVFQNLKLPFKLAKEHERFNYLIASGILNQQMLISANAKDRLAAGGKDQNLLGVNLNAVWAGASLFNWATGRPDPSTSWIGWFGSGMQNTSFNFNRYATGMGQVLDTLPNWARTAHQIYAASSFALFLLAPIAALASNATGYKLPTIDIPHLATAMDYSTKAYTALRMWGAVKPVIDRIPEYRASYISRRKNVMKAVALDLFNITTQAYMSYSFLTAPPGSAP